MPRKTLLDIARELDPDTRTDMEKADDNVRIVQGFKRHHEKWDGRKEGQTALADKLGQALIDKEAVAMRERAAARKRNR